MGTRHYSTFVKLRACTASLLITVYMCYKALVRSSSSSSTNSHLCYQDSTWQKRGHRRPGTQRQWPLSHTSSTSTQARIDRLESLIQSVIENRSTQTGVGGLQTLSHDIEKVHAISEWNEHTIQDGSREWFGYGERITIAINRLDFTNITNATGLPSHSFYYFCRYTTMERRSFRTEMLGLKKSAAAEHGRPWNAKMSEYKSLATRPNDSGLSAPPYRGGPFGTEKGGLAGPNVALVTLIRLGRPSLPFTACT